MIHYLPICFILALLGTLLVNPALYCSIFKKRKEYKEALTQAKKNKQEEKKYIHNVRKSDYSIFCAKGLTTSLILGQFFAFFVTFAFSIFVLYFYGTIAVKWSTILAYLWIPAIVQFLSFFFVWDDNKSCFKSSIENSIAILSFILTVIFLVIPIAIGIHKGAYNYLYPYDDITFMEENYEGTPVVDVTELLEKANLADGSSLKEPIYRNGNWIYPVANDNSHVTSSGYFVVNSTGENITFVKKDIVYSPWITSRNSINLTVRRKLPSAVLFGDSTFQIEPETGDIYFCTFYGDYAFFRAGRIVNGAIMINATTGEYTCYSLDELPDWISGISF